MALVSLHDADMRTRDYLRTMINKEYNSEYFVIVRASLDEHGNPTRIEEYLYPRLDAVVDTLRSPNPDVFTSLTTAISYICKHYNDPPSDTEIIRPFGAAPP